MTTLTIDDATAGLLLQALSSSIGLRGETGQKRGSWPIPSKGTVKPRAAIEDRDALLGAVKTAWTTVDTKAAGLLAATAARQMADDAETAARLAFQADRENAALGDAWITADQAATTAMAEEEAAVTSYQTARRDLGAAYAALGAAVRPYITG